MQLESVSDATRSIVAWRQSQRKLPQEEPQQPQQAQPPQQGQTSSGDGASDAPTSPRMPAMPSVGVGEGAALTPRSSKRLFDGLSEAESDRRKELENITIEREKLLDRAAQFRERVMVRHVSLRRQERTLSGQAGQLLKALKLEEARVNTLSMAMHRLQKQRKQLLTRIQEPSWAVPHHYHMTAMEHALGHQQPHILDVSGMIRGHLRIFAIANAAVHWQKNASHVLNKAKTARVRVSEQIKRVYRQLRTARVNLKELERLLEALNSKLGPSVRTRTRDKEKIAVGPAGVGAGAGGQGVSVPPFATSPAYNARLHQQDAGSVSAAVAQSLAEEEEEEEKEQKRHRRKPSIDFLTPPEEIVRAPIPSPVSSRPSSRTPAYRREQLAATPAMQGSASGAESSPPDSPPGSPAFAPSVPSSRTMATSSRSGAGRPRGGGPPNPFAGYRDVKMRFFQALNLTPPQLSPSSVRSSESDDGLLSTSSGGEQPAEEKLSVSATEGGEELSGSTSAVSIATGGGLAGGDGAGDGSKQEDGGAAEEWKELVELMAKLDPLEKAKQAAWEELESVLDHREKLRYEIDVTRRMDEQQQQQQQQQQQREDQT